MQCRTHRRLGGIHEDYVVLYLSGCTCCARCNGDSGGGYFLLIESFRLLCGCRDRRGYDYRCYFPYVVRKARNYEYVRSCRRIFLKPAMLQDLAGLHFLRTVTACYFGDPTGKCPAEYGRHASATDNFLAVAWKFPSPRLADSPAGESSLRLSIPRREARRRFA